MPNYDEENQIHYGVIHNDRVLQAWADSCDAFYPRTSDGVTEEPFKFYYNREGYRAHQDSGDVNIMVTKSPYCTYANLCSPCYPNAGNLDDTPGAYRTYCFGHDWFDSGIAPYPVFTVDTDEPVRPEENALLQEIINTPIPPEPPKTWQDWLRDIPRLLWEAVGFVLYLLDEHAPIVALVSVGLVLLYLFTQTNFAESFTQFLFLPVKDMHVGELILVAFIVSFWFRK